MLSFAFATLIVVHFSYIIPYTVEIVLMNCYKLSFSAWIPYPNPFVMFCDPIYGRKY